MVSELYLNVPHAVMSVRVTKSLQIDLRWVSPFNVISLDVAALACSHYTVAFKRKQTYHVFDPAKYSAATVPFTQDTRIVLCFMPQ